MDPRSVGVRTRTPPAVPLTRGDTCTQAKAAGSEVGLPVEISKMTAVAEHCNRLQVISRRFVEQASRFLGNELDHIADQSLKASAAPTGTATATVRLNRLEITTCDPR